MQIAKDLAKLRQVNQVGGIGGSFPVEMSDLTRAALSLDKIGFSFPLRNSFLSPSKP